jgi:hypothetical protein
LIQEGICSSVRVYEDAHRKQVYLRLDFDPQEELITKAIATILTSTSVLRESESFDILIHVMGRRLDNIMPSDPVYYKQ